MAYKLKKNLANRKNYGSARNTNKIKYIVIHFTANDGDSDEGNGNYFHNNVVKASAHYFVDSDSITQSVPDDHVAWSVGGRKYPSCKATGGGKFYKKCTNTNSLSIEICDDKKGGGVYPSKATIENAIAFTKLKMKEYNVPSERVIRHFDVVGKLCPAYWCGDAKKNKLWLTEFHNKISESGVVSKPSPHKPSVDHNDIAVDGSWGKECTKATQRFLKTKVDGIVSGQPLCNKKYLEAAYTGSWKFVSRKASGSNMVRALQGYLGVTVDGYFGKGSVMAMQRFLKSKGYDVSVDGYMGRNTVKAWQRYLNSM